ncbi:hypothetical protein SLEP1_g15212 [Rubroshorea leprosula]|uniref:Uncharacterized protein n=1 Tax=Rubroshorea leprosula TaxID=152421 RepID=A0AAV5ILM3_9ROSI|nr:hypothetical protein SLEP1_g15212 [Rubroshorea leprosula]
MISQLQSLPMIEHFLYKFQPWLNFMLKPFFSSEGVICFSNLSCYNTRVCEISEALCNQSLVHCSTLSSQGLNKNLKTVGCKLSNVLRFFIIYKAHAFTSLI